MVAAVKKGKKYISLPFSYCVGPLFNNKKLYTQLVEDLNQQSITIEYLQAMENDIIHSTITTSFADIKGLKNQKPKFSKNTRSKINRSEKKGFSFQEENDIENFFEVLSRNMHKLGTPIHGKAFYRDIFKQIPSRIYSVFIDSKPVASYFIIETLDVLHHTKKAWCILWASSLSMYNRDYVNYFAYNELIEAAMRNGIDLIDFGRSGTDSSLHEFKKKWSNRHIPLIKVNADNTYYKDNALLRFFSNQWKRLPYQMTIALGPHVRRFLP